MPSGYLNCSLDFILHLDQHLKELVANYGYWVYGIIFAIVFAETGLVIFPFLPGDSLLFAVGLLARRDLLHIYVAVPVVIGAALSGDMVNYQIGKHFGHRLFTNEKSKIFKPANLAKTHEFFEKHGGKTIILARFVPIVRTFAPFVAGMSAMSFRTFISYSICGACLWVLACMMGGYALGGYPLIQQHPELAALVVVLFTIIPMIVEVVRHRLKKKAALAARTNGSLATPVKVNTDAAKTGGSGTTSE